MQVHTCLQSSHAAVRCAWKWRVDFLGKEDALRRELAGRQDGVQEDACEQGRDEVVTLSLTVYSVDRDGSLTFQVIAFWSIAGLFYHEMIIVP